LLDKEREGEGGGGREGGEKERAGGRGREGGREREGGGREREREREHQIYSTSLHRFRIILP